MVFGLIQDEQLLISSILNYGVRHHGGSRIVSRPVEDPKNIHTYSFREFGVRVKKLSIALAKLGLKEGDVAGTIAMNTHRHMELYYGLSCSGYICHTLNPRLHINEIIYIMNHAEDKVIFFDVAFLPIVAGLQKSGQVPKVEKWVCMVGRGHMPAAEGILCYEDLLAESNEAEVAAHSWPQFDERTASALCYTSGTTGNPKGVLYQHRSTVLHAYGAALPDAFGIGAGDVVLPVVPLFHAQAWSIPFSALICGTSVVLPGALMDGKSLLELMDNYGVTSAAGVPTVWRSLLDAAHAAGGFKTLKRTLVGGSALPLAMIKEFRALGVQAVQGWGMTEMSPLGTVSTPLPRQVAELSVDELAEVTALQGRACFGVDMKVVDDNKQELEWGSGKAGHLMVKGWWIAKAYHKLDTQILDADGWFATGDIGTISADGFLHLTDRSKDVIKSGGEWISSIAIENLCHHPAVALAACIGVPHPKWDERPVLVLQLKPGVEQPSKEEILGLYVGKVAKFQQPDDVIFVDAIPIGPTGKILKNRLRDQYAATHKWAE